MLKNVLMSALICTSLLNAQEHGELVINQERGTYQLNFETTYVTYVNLDIELMISLPDGYTFAASIPGSKDFIHASPIQNTMYVTKTCEDFFQTNLSMHVLTPEGLEDKLLFKLISKKDAPKVLAIHFQQPNSSEMNRVVETVKSRYNEQLKKALSEQESELDKAIHEETISKGRAWFIKNKRGDILLDYKGAKVVFDGLFNSRNETYIFIRTPNQKEQCHIVNIQKAGLHKREADAELVTSIDEADGSFTMVYKIPFIEPIYKKFKSRWQDFTITYEVWSKVFRQTFKIS